MRTGWAIALLPCGVLLAATGLAATAPMPLSQRPQYIQANGVSLRYELSGRGRSTVVLLHEVGMNLDSWDEIMPELRSDHRVLRYDLRGFGLSEKIHAPLTLHDEVEDLHALLDALQITRPVTVVGGAIGASIAVRFAKTYPERTRGLVLISPIFNSPTRPASPAATRPAPRPAALDPATLIETSGIRAYLDSRQVDALYPPALRTDPGRLRRFWGIELSGDAHSRAATLRMLTASGNVSGDLSAIRCPTLVVATALFPLRPPATVKPIADAIPGARFEILPTGHLAALESPREVAALLERFFRDSGS